MKKASRSMGTRSKQ